MRDRQKGLAAKHFPEGRARARARSGPQLSRVSAILEVRPHARERARRQKKSPTRGKPYEMHTSFSRLYGPAVLFWLSNAKKNCGTALSTTVDELSRKGPQIVTLATR